MKIQALHRSIFLIYFAVITTFITISCQSPDLENDRAEKFPLLPVVNFPSDGEVVAEICPVLSVFNVETDKPGPFYYDFEVFSDLALENKVASRSHILQGTYGGPPYSTANNDQTTFQTTSWQVYPPLATNQQFWWRVRAHRGDMSGEWMRPVRLTVENASLPGLLSPINNQLVCPLNLFFEVTNVAGSTSDDVTYDFYVYRDPGLRHLFGAVTDVPSNPEGQTGAMLTTTLPDQQQFWWRSRVRKNSLPGSWTNPTPFWTEVISPVRLVAPIAYTSTHQFQPELIVQNSLNLCELDLIYDFEVYRDETLTSKIAEVHDLSQGQFELTSWVVDRHVPGNVHLFWRCRAKTDGYTGQWSDTGVFIIDSNARSDDVYAESVVHCGVTCPYSVQYRDCNEALGEPDFWWEYSSETPDGFAYYGFVSLGIRGSIIVDMGEGTEIINGEGADFRIWQSVSREEFQVFVAEHASGPYFDLGTAGTGWITKNDPIDPFFTPENEIYPYSNSGWCYTTGEAGYSGEIGMCDVSGSGFDKIRFVRILDLQPWGDLRKDCYYFDRENGSGAWIQYWHAGSDIDSIEAFYIP